MDDYVWINDLAGEIGRSVTATWRLVKVYSIPTFKRPLDRKTYVKRGDVSALLATFQPKARAES